MGLRQMQCPLYFWWIDEITKTTSSQYVKCVDVNLKLHFLLGTLSPRCTLTSAVGTTSQYCQPRQAKHYKHDTLALRWWPDCCIPKLNRAQDHIQNNIHMTTTRRLMFKLLETKNTPECERQRTNCRSLREQPSKRGIVQNVCSREQQQQKEETEFVETESQRPGCVVTTTRDTLRQASGKRKCNRINPLCSLRARQPEYNVHYIVFHHCTASNTREVKRVSVWCAIREEGKLVLNGFIRKLITDISAQNFTTAS